MPTNASTPELEAAIRDIVTRPVASPSAPSDSASRPAPVAYELSRLSQFCGRWIRHGDWYPDRVVRLFRRDRARFSDDLVHERVIVDGPVGRLRGDLLHHTMPTFEGRTREDEPLQQAAVPPTARAPAIVAASARRSATVPGPFCGGTWCGAAFSTAPPASSLRPTSPKERTGAT